MKSFSLVILKKLKWIFYDIVYATTSYNTKQQNMKLVAELFGKGIKVKDLTPQQMTIYRRAVMARYKQRQEDKIVKLLEETIDEMRKDGYAILPDTEAVLDEAIDEVFNVGLNPEAVPYIPYHLQLD